MTTRSRKSTPRASKSRQAGAKMNMAGIAPAIFISVGSRSLLLDREHPDDAALRHVVLDPDIIAGQRILDALRVDPPARLDRDILRAVHLIHGRHSHDAGV